MVNSALGPPGSLNRVPVFIGWSRGGNITSGEWQVTLCDPVIWHVSSRGGGTSFLRISILLRVSQTLQANEEGVRWILSKYVIEIFIDKTYST